MARPSRVPRWTATLIARRSAPPSSRRSIYATIRLASHREHWFHAAGCQSWLLVERDTRTHRNRQGRSCANAGAGVVSGGGFRLSSGGSIDTVPPALVQLRRQALRGLCWRYAGVRIAREWRPRLRPLVQISSSARRLFGRARGAERPRRVARGPRREPNVKATTIELYERARRVEPESLAFARLRRHGAERAY